MFNLNHHGPLKILNHHEVQSKTWFMKKGSFLSGPVIIDIRAFPNQIFLSLSKNITFSPRKRHFKREKYFTKTIRHNSLVIRTNFRKNRREKTKILIWRLFPMTSQRKTKF
jgi:hypothetical protein